MSRGFGSDNHSGVHPDILEGLISANRDHAPSYGTDDWTHQAQEIFRQHFGPATEIFFVFNGTAANVLSLRAMAKPYQAILCGDTSHLHVDECGAPEFFSGCKLWPLPTKNGKLQIPDLEKNLIRRGDQHFSQMSVLSITQPTELGTVYSIDETRALAKWAHQNKILVHVDGARLANACISLNQNFRQITTDLGVDVVSFGGTKNGLMMGEAVLFLNPSLAKEFMYLRKQSAQLPSKTRFISSQFISYFKNDLWKKVATHSTQMAQYLYQQVKDLPGVEVTQAVQSNAVFARIPQSWVGPLRKEVFFYVWDENTFECRWMTSWDTEKSDIDRFAKKLKELGS